MDSFATRRNQNSKLLILILKLKLRSYQDMVSIYIKFRTLNIMEYMPQIKKNMDIKNGSFLTYEHKIQIYKTYIWEEKKMIKRKNVWSYATKNLQKSSSHNNNKLNTSHPSTHSFLIPSSQRISPPLKHPLSTHNVSQ